MIENWSDRIPSGPSNYEPKLRRRTKADLVRGHSIHFPTECRRVWKRLPLRVPMTAWQSHLHYGHVLEVSGMEIEEPGAWSHQSVSFPLS